MSHSWYLYSERSAKDVLGVEGAIDQALHAWVEERGAEEERDETCGQIGPGGPIPTGRERDEEAPGTRGLVRLPRPVDAAIRARLARCKGSLAIDYVRGSGVEHPLQVSVLRYLLTSLAPCVIDWGDRSFELGERALLGLKEHRSRGPLGVTELPKKPARRRAERQGEVRAARILQSLERCAADAETSVDLGRWLAKRSALEERYLRLLGMSGAMSDDEAARQLHTTPEAIDPTVAALDAALTELAR